MSHEPLTPYNILDFKAVLKHVFYIGGDPEAIHCDVTDRRFSTWEYAAQVLLDRYATVFFGDMASPRQLIVAHDMGHEYRSVVFPEYKANRKETEKSPVEEEQLDLLFKWAKNLFSALGATQIGVEGVEADDVIAWLCDNIEYPKQVFTVDADLLQLAGRKDTLVYLKMEPYFTGEKDGIPLHLTSIAKSIIGDPSDGYGGVRGLGAAKFQDMLEKFGEDGIQQLQDCISANNPKDVDDAIEQTGDKNLVKLREQWGEWRKMWKLAQLHPELCWKPRSKNLTKTTVHKRIGDQSKLQKVLYQAGADDMWPDFEPMMPRSIAVDASNWNSIRSDILNEMAQSDVVAFDYETDDKDPNPRFVEAAPGSTFVDMLSHTLTGASFQFGRHLENSIYVTVDHKDADNLDRQVIADILQHARKHATLVAQNFYFEGVISRTNLGLTLDNVHDTKVMQRYYDENAEAGLKSMSKKYLGYDQASYQETVGDKGGMSELTLDEVVGYGIDDSLVTGALYDLLKLLLQLDGQWDFYRRWAINPSCVLQDSYINGVDIDWNLQEQLHKDDLETISESMGELREILHENVTGEITAGCKSYIESEEEYIRKSWKRQLKEKQQLQGDALNDAVRSKVYNWKNKLYEACNYLPFTEEEIFPEFKLTVKQVGEAADALGLEPIDKVTNKAITEYLSDYGYIGQGGEDEKENLDADQLEFLQALNDAFSAGALRIKTIENQIEKANVQEDEEKAHRLYDDLERANEAFEKLGVVVQRANKVESKVVKSGDELSLNSPVQMLHLLYCKIGVPVRLRSTGALSKGRMVLGLKENGPASDEKAIETAIANDVEPGSWQERALQLLLKAKSAQTRVGLYHTKYPMWKHHQDGKMHPMFTDAGTDTRRPTGSSPNVLQVSKKFAAMRDQFVPPGPDWFVVPIDYASQEIRLMAEEADDPVMKSVYDPENEKDLHSMTGSAIAGMPYEAFTQALEDTEHELHPMVKAVRGRKAKGCIAEGSLVLTDHGLVPIELITRQHRVWDGVEFVEHEGLEYKGVQDVITVGPLTATPDHEVYLDDGRSIPFGEYATQQGEPRLAVGAVESTPVGYAAGDRRPLGGIREQEGRGHGHHPLHCLRPGEDESREQPQGRACRPLQMPTEEVHHGGSPEACGALLRDGPALQQPEQSVVQELRGPGDHAGLSVGGRFCGVGSDEPSPQELQGSGDRPNRQQCGLRSGEPSSGYVPTEPQQYATEPTSDVQGRRGSEGAPMGPHQDGPSGVSVWQEDGSAVSGEGDEPGSDTSVPAPSRRRAKVYDIVNAGPRHRFTVSGVVVHNCNFGLAYGAGAATLSRNLIIPLEEAKQLLDNAFGLYRRIKPWQEETSQFMSRNGFTLTAFGTKRHATSDIFHKEKGKVARQHRQGVNATIQGTAAEMLRIVLTKMWETDMLGRLRMVFFAPVYDETVAFVHKDDVVQYCREMCDIMSSATPPTHDTPQIPEISLGKTWGSVRELGRWSEGMPAILEDAMNETQEKAA